jgi:hypothetical protein
MTVIRLEQQKTDLVVTVNVPHNSPNLARLEGAVASPGYSGSLSGVKGQLLEAGLKVRDEFLRTLRIVDWGLFVSEE